MLQTHVFHLQTSKEPCSRGEDPAFQMQAVWQQAVNLDNPRRSCSRDAQMMAENHSFRSIIFDNPISGLGFFRVGTVKLETD